jgi:hypothetical protein
MNSGGNRRKIIITVVSVLILLIGAIVILLGLSNGQQELKDVHISIRPTTATPVTIYYEGVLIGDYNNPEIDLQLSKNVRNLTLSSPSFEEKTIQVEGTSMVVTLEPKTNVTTEELIVDGLSDNGYIDFDNKYRIINPKVYGNNEWVYGILVEINESNNGEQVVIKVDGNNKEVVYAGTDFSISSLIAVGVPEGVAEQIIKDSNEAN